MKVLIIQENGHHDVNRNFRECFCLQRAFRHYGLEADVWGKLHENYDAAPDWDAYDLIFTFENWDWLPDLSKVKTKKILWAIDSHCKGPRVYENIANEHNYDFLFHAVPYFANKNNWLPNCYDDELIKPLNLDKIYDIGFCGNIVNRGNLINLLQRSFDNFKLDEFVMGDNMVRAINSYKVHFNANISIDINYRNFETIGCGTCLLTSHHDYLHHLGFQDGENCLIYKNQQEMIEKIHWALENPDEVGKINMGASVLAERHTYKNRIKTLLNFLNIEEGKYEFNNVR